ncbi:hypothetical protein [Streptomyces griseus]|uniref:hypothetical protein n=1 Tax=Streptomyces griseus TaxID=1911 RepID=UPI001943885D
MHACGPASGSWTASGCPPRHPGSCGPDHRVEGTAPWALNEVEWDATPLRALVNGGKPARNQLGCGDLNLLIERDRCLARTSGVRATVWTPDELLPSYA